VTVRRLSAWCGMTVAAPLRRKTHSSTRVDSPSLPNPIRSNRRRHAEYAHLPGSKRRRKDWLEVSIIGLGGYHIGTVAGEEVDNMVPGAGSRRSYFLISWE